MPLRVPMVTVENTHDDFAWLTNYFETLMSSVIWMPCTSATTALRDATDSRRGRQARQEVIRPSRLAGTRLQLPRSRLAPKPLHSSGAAHLLFFTGTDTIPALDLIETYYGAPDDYLIGGSVAATEHSVMCAGGEDGELANDQQIARSLPFWHPLGRLRHVGPLAPYHGHSPKAQGPDHVA